MRKILTATSILTLLSGHAANAESMSDIMDRQGKEAQRTYGEEQRKKDIENNLGPTSSVGDTLAIAGILAGICYALGCFDSPKNTPQRR